MKKIIKVVCLVLALVCLFSACGKKTAKKKPANAETSVTYKDLLDFTVDIEKGKEPVILQLSDPQIIDSSQARSSDRLGDFFTTYWGPDKIEERCFKYIRDTITNTKPDFIFVAGDLIYGEFDDNGTAFTQFFNFMESFKIPWSPVFGNHDGESAKGIDWYCDTFENAKYCKFNRGTTRGNCNYTVGITQDGKLLRVFYLMDSNDNGTASDASKNNGKTVISQGISGMQKSWYFSNIKELQKHYPDVKISFVFHEAIKAFDDAFKKYGYQSGIHTSVNIDSHPDKADTDFGYIGGSSSSKWYWDREDGVWNQIKTLGVDSVFVGHSHSNSASVLYEGVRLHFGLKSSEYCDCNWLTSYGYITSAGSPPKPVEKSIPIIGGSVFNLSEDGEILNLHHYYSGKAAKVDFSKIK